MIKDNLRLISLIPHRDAVKQADEYKQKMFAHGFSGAYSFPCLIPLALAQKPYTLGKLKNIAVFLRKMISEKNLDGSSSGMCTLNKPCISDDLPGIILGGLSFDLPRNGLLLANNDTVLPRFVLGLGVLKAGTEESFLRFTKHVPPPPILFRACSLANMIYSADEDGASFWEIGHPVWLPSLSKGKKHG